jgi:hypothetical protein
VKFLSGLVYPRSIVGVNHKNESLCAREVVSPQRTDLVLTTYVPHVEFDILVRHGLDVEADSRNRGHVLVEFEFVKDCCSWLDLDCTTIRAQLSYPHVTYLSCLPHRGPT